MTDCDVQWTDIHTEQGTYQDVGTDIEFIRERLHAVDEDGNIKIGVEAFAVIWRHSPGEGWKAKIISLPVIKQLAHIVYNIFARSLYIWNRWKKHW